MRTGEVAVHGRAVVVTVATLDAEAIGEERIASGSVDEEARAPPAFALGGAGLDAHVFARGKLDFRDAAFLQRVRTFARGVAEQNLVVLGAPHFESGRIGLVPGLAEVERDRRAMPRRIELGAVLGHADAHD